MPPSNDSKRFFRLTPETSGWGVLPGSPAWLVAKITKISHKPKTNVEFAEELRNSPDMIYEDSVGNGGAFEDWDISLKIRADQFPHFLRMVGFDDTKTTHSGETVVFDHLMKPGVGLSYALQMYDGQLCYQGLGFVATDLDITSKGGENGTYDVQIKGWSKKATFVSVPTITLPGNTSYRMLKPTNTGVAITLGGGTANSLISEWKLSWKRDAKPFYTQTGTVDPYRPEYGKRQLDVEVTLLFDDTADYQAAVAVPVTSKALTITLPHTESLGVGPTNPGVTFNIPRFVYAEPSVDNSNPANTATLKGKAAYDTTLGGQWSALVVNESSTAY